MKKFKKILPLIIFIAIVAIIITIIVSLTSKKTAPYSTLIAQIKENNVVSINLDDNVATVVFKNDFETLDEEGKKLSITKGTEYEIIVNSVDSFETLVNSALTLKSDAFVYTEQDNTVPFIVEMIPYILIVVVFGFFMYIMIAQSSMGNSKIMNFGRSRARLYTSSKIKFADVAGAEEEKEEMSEIVSFLKEPKLYENLGARIPKGVLLVGPPGTGKTYLAKAVAGEAGVPFFSISGSDFVEMYVGVGASRVRDLFEQAKKNSPCIIFIDEIDAVGRHRGAGLGGGHDEREQTLNQLLVEMDGFQKNDNIIVMAATNRPDILDPALTRPGRFDRKIVVGYPDVKAREAILQVHAKNKPLADDVSLSDVAKNTSGFTAADLENLLNEAALLSARDKKEKIETGALKEAVFRVIVGPEKKSKVMTEKSKWLTAVHETGHAIIVKLVSTTDKVDRVSIIPAGMAGGYTAHRPDEDKDYQTKSQLLEEIDICFGGRAAEQIMLGEISTGASSDLKHANNVARSMVTKYGMSDKLGNMIVSSGDSDEVFIGRDYGHIKSVSDSTASVVDEEVKNIMDKEYNKVIDILTKNKDKLESIAKILLEKEKIEGNEFEELMNA